MATAITRLNSRAAATFAPTTVSSRPLSRNVPAWMLVPSRLPKAPKMLPFTASAAGTSRRRPGSSSSVSVVNASVTPATRLFTAAMVSATRLSR